MTREGNMTDDIKASAQRIWLAGLGALSLAEEKGGVWFRNLVDKGADFEARGKDRAESVREKVEGGLGSARERVGGLGSDVREKVGGAAKRVMSEVGSVRGAVEDRVDRAVQGAFERAGVPTREEIAVLSTRIEELTRLVEQLKSNTTEG